MIDARTVHDRGLGAGGRFVDPPYTNREAHPAARRGHTMSLIDGYIYLFGGYTVGYTCENGRSSESCRLRNGVSNELWRLDPITHTW